MAANSTCPRETERCRHHHSSDEWERTSCDPRWHDKSSLPGQEALFAAMRSYSHRDLNAAEEYCKKAWRNSPIMSGSSGYQGLQAFNCLALIHAEKRQFSVAEAEFEEALEHSRVLYGTTHPRTHSALSSLATVCSHQEKYSKAENLLVELFQIQERSSGGEPRGALHALK